MSGVRTLFVETPDSDLNKTLKHIQDNIILPAHLPPKQQRLVFDPKMTSRLEQDPIILEIEGYEHRFSTIDRFNDVQNSKVLWNKTLTLMNTSGDWSNLAAFLAGYKKAGVKIRFFHWGALVRLAGEGGGLPVLIDCAKQGEKTGFRLNTAEKVAKIFLYVNQKIVASGLDEAETIQARKWAGVLLDLLQRPEHATSVGKLHLSKPVRGMLLFNQASATKAKQGAEEGFDKHLTLLKDEVAILQSLWAKALDTDITSDTDFSSLNPNLLARTPKKARKHGSLSGAQYVQLMAQTIRGIELSNELIGDEAAGLLPIRDALDKHLVAFIEDCAHSPKGYHTYYEEVVGRSPSWAGLTQVEEAGAADAEAVST